ncbi:arsenate reductase ArsC [Microbacterium testaceum]|uniref:arsenate reductase ArsC n=1 Tax=Microbacterium testaceum TaxID=2033 RepID=UPI0025B0A23E|nr:arsenate reductase ArsC [Microbacterium testaceum]WJS92480.1 arsenate reductase ArsC [Microbacterium testaceum]
MPDTTKPAALFVCVHNAGRSQMAADYLRALAGDSIDVYSAGSQPGNTVNPAAVTVTAEEGIDLSAATPQILTTDAARQADVVITMGCGDACPLLPGKRYEDWQLTDPAGQPVEVVREVRDDIKVRVQRLIDSLI